MTRKAHSADEIVSKLRLVDELNLQGRAVGQQFRRDRLLLGQDARDLPQS